MLIVLVFLLQKMANKFTRFKPKEWDYQARYNILQTRPEETPKQECLDTLEAMGQLGRYNTLVTGPLRVALGTRLHAVHEYIMEFYSSFAFKSKTEPFDEEGVQFRCEGEIAWAQIGDGAYDPSVTKSSQLWDPLHQYIHRVLSNYLCERRDNTGVVNLRDLTVLYCLHKRVPLCVTHLLLRNMHLNRLASSPTPIFFRGWIYRLFKTYVQRMPKSFCKGPWSGKVDITQYRSMGIIHEMGDGTVRFQTTQGHVSNPEEALVLHADPTRPFPQH
ncbi:hypothetical protein Hanom_Chr17g01577461 [Helianthus anomalus]